MSARTGHPRTEKLGAVGLRRTGKHGSVDILGLCLPSPHPFPATFPRQTAGGDRAPPRSGPAEPGGLGRAQGHYPNPGGTQRCGS